MNGKRILHVIRPAEGGMKEHLLNLAGALPARGYLMEVACPGETPMTAELAAMDIPVHVIDLAGPLNLMRDTRCVLQLKELMGRGKYDLVHFHGSKAGLVGRAAAVLAGSPKTVLTVHNFIVYKETGAVKKTVYRCGEKALSLHTTRIITVSRALKDDLVTNFGIPAEKIVPVYNGIEMAGYREMPDRRAARDELGVAPGALVVGTIARMAPQKGLNYLIDALPELIRKLAEAGHPDRLVCVIAGDGPLKAQLEAQARELGVEQNIRFTGFLQDIRPVLACLDVFVVPSIAEGLSITTIEAMAAGLPVVAARVGGLPELVADNVTGILVESRDSRQLAEAMCRLLTRPADREKFGRCGQASARENFSIEQMIQQTCQVYEGM